MSFVYIKYFPFMYCEMLLHLYSFIRIQIDCLSISELSHLEKAPDYYGNIPSFP